MSEKIVQLNEEVIRSRLKELMRGSVEETLNELLVAEAQKLTQAAQYERNEQRQDCRSGYYDRNLTGISFSRYRNSRESPLRLPSLSGTAAGRAVWGKHLLRCTWQVYPSDV